MKLELIQHNYQAINSCYVFNDFLDDLIYLDLLKNKIKALTIQDEMRRTTNVKANMTSYEKLLEQKEFNFLHTKILDTIAICYKLRTPHPNNKFKLKIKNSWGMLHKENERSILHNHLNTTWSVAFYLQIPNQTIFHLPEFDSKIDLQNNMLIFFPGFTNHSVEPFIGEGERLSMACNIMQEFE